MKKRGSIFVFLLVFSMGNIIAQDTSNLQQARYDRSSFGIGAGIDFGGLGINILAYPIKNLGVFGAAGYNGIEIGYNAGLKCRFFPNSKSLATPFLMAMYGTNGIVHIKNRTGYNKIFLGTTLGFGIESKITKERIGYWTFAVLIPIRDPEFENYVDYLKEEKDVKFDREPMPIGLSIGYRLIISNI